MDRLYNKKSEVLRVVIVEDEPPMLRFLHKLLEAMDGFEVIADCLNAEDAISILGEASIDVLISDIRMSGMNGLELAAKFRQLSSDTHIVIVTGYKSFEYAKAAIDLNIDAFIMKPIDREEFMEVLTRIRESYLEGYYAETQKQLEKAFRYNDKELFRMLLSEQGYHSCSAIIVYYPGDMNELFVCIKHIRNNYIYIVYKYAAIFFVKETEAEEVFRYIAVKFSGCSRKYDTVVCAKIDSLNGVAPTVAEIKEIYQKQILQVVVPGSFEVYLEDQIHEKVQKATTYDKDEEIYKRIEISILSKEWNFIWEQVDCIFRIWKTEQFPISHLRKRIHSMIALCEKSGILNSDRISLNDQIDENILSMDSYEDIKQYFLDTMRANIDTGNSASLKREMELFVSIRELVTQNLEQIYSLQEICNIFKVSQPYVRKIFIRYTGKSYNDFILEEKIQYAVKMIKCNPNIQVKDLAAMLGYEQLYFSTVFKKNTGLTPSQYKQMVMTTEKNPI